MGIVRKSRKIESNSRKPMIKQKKKAKIREKYDKLSKTILEKVSEEINNSPMAKTTIRKIFENALSMESEAIYNSKADYTYRANRSDPEARQYLKEFILNKLYETDFSEEEVEEFIEVYPINYFNGPKEIYTGTNTRFIAIARKVMISLDDDYDIKLAKLAQMLYQDLYGASLVDEFLYMGHTADGTKIEEIAVFGGHTVWFEVRGMKEKMDGIKFEKERIKQLVERFCINSETENINSTNPQVNTTTYTNHRLSLRCAPYTAWYSFNLRLHYDNFITREFRIANGSTTEQVETLFDYLMQFKAKVLLVGGQGTGKTTMARALMENAPKNTVVGTVESSLELNLKLIPNLIVEELQTIPGKSYDDALADLLRFGLDTMILGEIRTAEEVLTGMQVNQRQANGGVSTYHADTAKTAIYSMRALAMQTDIYKKESLALFDVCRSYDIIIMLGADKNGANATGERYVSGIYEIPNVTEDATDVEPIPIFERDPARKTLVKKNDISPFLRGEFLRRNFDPELLEKMLNA